MKIAVLQSNYLPWKGYFDIIRQAELFIFYDDVSYTKNDWRNRNKIKSRQGVEWITVPCGSSLDRLICEVELKDQRWQKKHWKQIQQNYSKAPFFEKYKDFFEEAYMGTKWKSLSEMNRFFIEQIATRFLGFDTRFGDSRNYDLQGAKKDRLLNLLEQVGATKYYSGPSAKNYITAADFAEKGIEVHWMDNSNYPEYPQLFGDFEHQVSIIDLLFNLGDQAKNYILPKGKDKLIL